MLLWDSSIDQATGSGLLAGVSLTKAQVPCGCCAHLCMGLVPMEWLWEMGVFHTTLYFD